MYALSPHFPSPYSIRLHNVHVCASGYGSHILPNTLHWLVYAALHPPRLRALSQTLQLCRRASQQLKYYLFDRITLCCPLFVAKSPRDYAVSLGRADVVAAIDNHAAEKDTPPSRVFFVKLDEEHRREADAGEIVPVSERLPGAQPPAAVAAESAVTPLDTAPEDGAATEVREEEEPLEAERVIAGVKQLCRLNLEVYSADQLFALQAALKAEYNRVTNFINTTPQPAVAPVQKSPGSDEAGDGSKAAAGVPTTTAGPSKPASSKLAPSGSASADACKDPAETKPASAAPGPSSSPCKTAAPESASTPQTKH
jgi:hypothetical protein